MDTPPRPPDDVRDPLAARFSVLGALVRSTARNLPPPQREQLARDLAQAAEREEEAGNLPAEALLIELHRAAHAAKDDPR